MELDIDEASIKSKSGPIVVAIALTVALLGAGVAFLVLNREAPLDPLRVAITLSGGVGQPFDDRFVDRFVAGLDDFGITGIAVPAPAETDAAALRALATEAGAAHALLLDLDIRRERDSFTDDAGLYRAELTVQLVSGETDTPSRSDAFSFAFAFERTSEREIANMVGGTWYELFFADILQSLYDSPALTDVLGEGQPLDVLEATATLRDRRAAFEARAGRVQGFESFCQNEADMLASMNGEGDPPVYCVGDPCGQWTVLGADQDGSHAYVQDVSRRLIVEVPYDGPSWAEPPEALLEIALDDSDSAPPPRTLFETGNILGFAQLTPDAGFVTVGAFAANQSLAAVTLDVASAEWRDVLVLEPGLRFSFSMPAPDGSRALLGLYDREARRRGEPWVWNVAQSTARQPLPFEGRATWLSDGQHVVGEIAPGRVGLAGPDGTLLEPSVELPGRVRHFLGDRDGATWLIWGNFEGCGLSALSADASGVALATGPTIPLPDCLETADMLPDGRLVGIAYATQEGDAPGDPEVVLVDTTVALAHVTVQHEVEGQLVPPPMSTLTPLTTGSWLEEASAVSGDGRRVVFNRRLSDWPSEYDIEVYRRVVCWLDLPQ